MNKSIIYMLFNSYAHTEHWMFTEYIQTKLCSQHPLVHKDPNPDIWHQSLTQCMMYWMIIAWQKGPISIIASPTFTSKTITNHFIFILFSSEKDEYNIRYIFYMVNNYSFKEHQFALQDYSFKEHQFALQEIHLTR